MKYIDRLPSKLVLHVQLGLHLRAVVDEGHSCTHHHEDEEQAGSDADHCWFLTFRCELCESCDLTDPLTPLAYKCTVPSAKYTMYSETIKLIFFLRNLEKLMNGKSWGLTLRERRIR